MKLGSKGMAKGMAALVTAWAVAACQSAPPALPPPPPQQVETGSTFTLLAPLTFQAGQAELYFQGGRLVASNALSPSLPVCRLVPQAGAPHSLMPGPLRVGSVSYDEREAGSSGAMFSSTRIALSTSPGQPGYAMTCGWAGPSAARRFVSSEQIYSALAGHFTMQLLR
jgi:hypothetical protein